jgi:hypothetical protein
MTSAKAQLIESQIKEDNIKDKTISDKIFREISKAFEYIFKFYDMHKELLSKLVEEKKNQGSGTDD